MSSREGGNNTGLHLLEAGIVIISRRLGGGLIACADETAFNVPPLYRDRPMWALGIGTGWICPL